MAKKKIGKEKATKKTDLNKLIDHLEKWREQLFDDPKISATKFNHMQSAIHGCKNIIRDHFGVERKGDIAWVK